MSLDAYYTLGRSGLRVSRLALGTMTFGDNWGWGAAEDTARAMFDRYLAAGGNFFDTADLYTEGASEELLGRATTTFWSAAAPDSHQSARRLGVPVRPPPAETVTMCLIFEPGQASVSHRPCASFAS